MSTDPNQFFVLRLLHPGLPVKSRLKQFSADLVIQMECDGLIEAIFSDEKGGMYAITDLGRKTWEEANGS